MTFAISDYTIVVVGFRAAVFVAVVVVLVAVQHLLDRSRR
jgi:hypothetical protein